MVLPVCGALLSLSDERALVAAVQAGDWNARSRLVVSNLSFVLAIARRYRGMQVPFEDLVAEGALGLLEASDRFDPAHGTRFITFATWWIRKRILLALDRRSGRTRRGSPPRVVPLEADTGRLGLLERLPDPAAPDAERTFLRKELLAEVHRALRRLRPREREILRLRFGLDGEEPRSLVEAATVVGVSRERIRQIEWDALETLRLELIPRRLSTRRPASIRTMS